MKEVVFDIKLNRAQLDLLDVINTHKFTLAAMSRQIGKSVLCKVLCTQWLLENNNQIGYVTPSLLLAKKFFNDLIDCIPQSLLVKSNGSDLTIKSITGSTLQFYSAEQSNRIRGNTFDYLILDEAAFYSDDNIWYAVLQPTIKVKGKKIIMISTPNGTRGFWYDLIQYSKTNSDYGFIKRTIYDDDMVHNIEEIKNSMPEILWRQEYLVEFISDNQSFFTNYHQCYQSFEFIYENIWAGIDWSANGKDETIVTFINKQNQIKQFKIEGTLDEKYKQIAELLNTYKLNGVYAEDNSIGAPMINELVKLTTQPITRFTTTNESKTQIITDLALSLQRKEIVYYDDELDYQLSTFNYKVTKTKKLSFMGLKDDRVMSLAFALKAKKDLSNNNQFIFL